MKTLDFNTLAPQTLMLVMCDEAKTKIEVGVPTERLVEQLQQIAPQLDLMMQEPENTKNQDLYELAARLISCNHSGLQVTAEDLRDKYHMNFEMMLAFFNAYVGFINEFTNEKN